ncbi:MAG: helix-turn-helix transcriptional regulator [Candidatus Aenigmatarchaeota archaeon]
MVKARMALLSLLFFVLFSSTAYAATVHGTTYDWSTLEPVSGIIVSINSTPSQSMVSTPGYSFELPPGSYLLKAELKRNNETELYEEQEIEIIEDGDFVIDFVLFPLVEDGIETDIGLEAGLGELTSEEPDYTIWIILAIILLALVVYLVKSRKRPKKKEKEIEDDLKQVLRIIRDAGGRMTQKELRMRIPQYSEAKISLMISDLENSGKIKKFKKGRANIIKII